MTTKSATEVKDVQIVRQGGKIVLPEAWPNDKMYDMGIEWLTRKKKEAETEFAVMAEFDAFPLDGAVALHRALADIYGWVDSVPTPGFFGPSPPALIAVPTGVKSFVQVPWGRLQIPGVAGFLNTALKPHPVPKFVLNGKTLNKHKEEIGRVIERTRYFLESQSIYKGQAVRLSLRWKREEDDFDPMEHAPKYIDLGQDAVSRLILSREAAKSVEVCVFGHIRYREQILREEGKWKRGVLLAGPYGCGKSMTAKATAQVAVENGVTFVYIDDARDLAEAYKFARQYMPAVIFCEDVDRVVQHERTAEVDEVLNILDGVDTKDDQILTVVTTNHVENISPALLRPGRFDNYVVIGPPDALAAERLLRVYGRGVFAPGTDLTGVAQRVARHRLIPAMIEEIARRSRLAARVRLGGGCPVGSVTQEDLLNTMEGMEPHWKLLEPKAEDKRSDFEKAADTHARVLGEALRDVGLGLEANGTTPEPEDDDDLLNLPEEYDLIGSETAPGNGSPGL